MADLLPKSRVTVEDAQKAAADRWQAAVSGLNVQLETLAQGMASDVPMAIPGAPLLQYKPSFLTKLGAGLGGTGTSIQEGYAKAAYANQQVQQNYDSMKVQQEGYRRMRLQQMNERIADIRGKAAEITGLRVPMEQEATISAEDRENKRLLSNQNARYQTAQMRAMGGSGREPKAQTLGTWNLGPQFANMRTGFEQGQAIGPLIANPEAPGSFIPDPESAGPLSSIADVDRTERVLISTLDLYDGPDRDAQIERVRAIAEAQRDILNNDAKLLDESSASVEDLVTSFYAPNTETPPDAADLNALLGINSFFTGEDLSLDEAIDVDAEVNAELGNLDLQWKARSIDASTYVKKKAASTAMAELRAALARGETKTIIDRAGKLVMLGTIETAAELAIIVGDRALAEEVFEQAKAHLGMQRKRSTEIDAMRDRIRARQIQGKY